MHRELWGLCSSSLYCSGGCMTGMCRDPQNQESTSCMHTRHAIYLPLMCPYWFGPRDKCTNRSKMPLPGETVLHDSAPGETVLHELCTSCFTFLES